MNNKKLLYLFIAISCTNWGMDNSQRETDDFQKGREAAKRSALEAAKQSQLLENRLKEIRQEKYNKWEQDVFARAEKARSAAPLGTEYVAFDVPPNPLIIPGPANVAGQSSPPAPVPLHISEPPPYRPPLTYQAPDPKSLSYSPLAENPGPNCIVLNKKEMREVAPLALFLANPDRNTIVDNNQEMHNKARQALFEVQPKEVANIVNKKGRNYYTAAAVVTASCAATWFTVELVKTYKNFPVDQWKKENYYNRAKLLLTQTVQSMKARPKQLALFLRKHISQPII